MTVRALSELTEQAQKACTAFLAECERQGLNVLVTETYRSQKRQNELYAQGRTKPGNIVTWTKKSKHTSRLAWDICQNIKGKEYSDTAFFKRCGKIAKSLGITWGGDWSTPDMPHFEVSKDYVYKEFDAMTQAEREEFDKLKKQVEQNIEKVYHYTEEIPDWARPTIQQLMDDGVFAGSAADDLNLPESMMRTMVITKRMIDRYVKG